MALTPDFSFTQDSNDITIGVLENTTPDYGVGGNPARNASAEYILWSKTDQSGNRTFYNPGQGDVLTKLLYDVSTAIDGWYQTFRLRIGIYDNVANYVEEQQSGDVITQYASIVYYGSTNKIYKCIADSTGNLPTDVIFWEEVVEVDWGDLIENSNVSVFTENFRVQTRSDNCASSKFAELEDCGCKNSNDKRNKDAYYLNGLLIAADNEWTQGNYDEYDKVIRKIESKCSTA